VPEASFPQPTDERTNGGSAINAETVNITNNEGITQFGSNSQAVINHVYQAARESGCPVPEQILPIGGRDKALRDLADRLQKGHTIALTALHGTGGIGKTSLAKSLAFNLFVNGTFRVVLWVNVGKTPEPLALLRNWAVLADPHLSSLIPTPPPDHIRANLHKLVEKDWAHCPSNRVLVVLDDVWNTPESRKATALLRPACPLNSTILLTSRDEAVMIDLGADCYRLDTFTNKEGVAMLQTFNLHSGAKKLSRLVELLHGHALTLELAAKRILKYGNTDHAFERVLSSYANLSAGLDLQKESTLASCFEPSYADLTPAEQANFRALGAVAYNEPFDLALLAALWQTDSDTAFETANNLRLLSLLAQEKNYGEDWYKLHPLLHAYARTLLKNSDEYSQAQARYHDYNIKVAEKFRELPPEAWGQLVVYLPHIRTTGRELLHLTTATSSDAALSFRAMNFAANIRHYLFQRREEREGQSEWPEMGLAAARALQNQKHEASFLNDLGLLYQDLGDNQQALSYFHQALPLRRQVGDRKSEATTLNNIGGVYANLGDNQQALSYFQQALPLRRQVGDRKGEATTLNNIGGVYANLGDNQQALSYYQQALPLFRQVGDRTGEATTLNNIGLVYANLGDNQQALSYFHQALPLSRQVGDRTGEAVTCFNLGRLYETLGDLDRAIEYVTRCVELEEQISHPDLESDRAYLSRLHQSRDQRS
jgi:tetratricopeptide (TPR) repeat protein